jgi:3-methyladenine DNA glycosylase AlkD
MSVITEELVHQADLKYKSFHSKLIPTVDSDTVLGVRAPICRQIAKKYAGTPEGEDFLSSLPHKYYDEGIVHGYMLGFLDADKALPRLEALLPYMDNWAIVDMTVASLKKFFASPSNRLDFVKSCLASSEEYTVRFGIVSLLCYYLDDFASIAIDLVRAIRRDEFYIKMAQAWFFATALTKKYELALPVIKSGELDRWTHNKSIQKARESYQLSIDKKDYLRTFRR